MARKSHRPKTVTVKPNEYQPSKAEVEEEIQIRAEPEQLLKAVVQDVKIKRSRKARK